MPPIDLIIPVYNEGEFIARVMDALLLQVKTPFRALVCYDHDEDDTLPVLANYPRRAELDLVLVKNEGKGVHGAVCSGFRAGTAPAAIVYPADDDFNAGILDAMVAKWQDGCDIVCASRFLPGGCMEGCPWLKAALVRLASFTLHWLARLPVHDATSGFRLFSRRVLQETPIESSLGFTYSLELLVKTHRRGWRIGEVPARWFERKHGQSRFRVLRWLPAYLRWYFYAFATTWLGRKAT
jgi:dolichol-phosphate mannosyltransferase